MIIPYPKHYASYSVAWYMVSLLLHACMFVGVAVVAVWWPVHADDSQKKPQAMQIALVRVPKQSQNTQSTQTLRAASTLSPSNKTPVPSTKKAHEGTSTKPAEAKRHTSQVKRSEDTHQHASLLHTKPMNAPQSTEFKKQPSGIKADTAQVSPATALRVAQGKAIDTKAQHVQEKQRALPISHAANHAQQVQQGQQMLIEQSKAQRVLSWKEVDGEQKKSLVKKKIEAEKQRLEAERVQREEEEKQRLEAERVRKEQEEKQRLEAEHVQREQEEKQRLEAERVRKEQEEKQRLEAERVRKEQEEKQRLEAERVQREKEKKRRLEAELIRQEEERLRQEAEKKQRERVRLQQLAEEKKLKQQAYELAKQQAIEEIQMHIAEFATLNDKDMLGLSARLKVHLDQQGHVIKVTVQKSSGNPRFDEIAVNTWFKASPIPMPNDPDFPELRRESQDINFDFHLTELSGQ